MVGGLLQKVAMMSAPDLLMQSGLKQFEQFGGGLTPQQRKAIDEWVPMLRQGSMSAVPTPGSGRSGTNAGPAAGFGGLIKVKSIDLLGQKKKNPTIAFYAAGIGVMFLLFSCTGAGGALLEEVESGTLDRLLGTRIGMTGLIFGKWLFLTLMGISQLFLMFLWGAVMFKVELWSHFGGFLIMTLVTAAAAGGFGMLLAAACRTRAQLAGLSTIVILIMSAAGGSMVPRFIMPETMQKLGLLTFNGWALDGYIKVFWREEPLLQLWPQVLVLGLLTAVFLFAARRLAGRWEVI
jgi:ABC-2 type transport system permease protein